MGAVLKDRLLVFELAENDFLEAVKRSKSRVILAILIESDDDVRNNNNNNNNNSNCVYESRNVTVNHAVLGELENRNLPRFYVMDDLRYS